VRGDGEQELPLSAGLMEDGKVNIGHFVSEKRSS